MVLTIDGLSIGWNPTCRMLTCNYDPAGNMIGDFQSNVSPRK